MKAYFKNRCLILESENGTEDLAMEYWADHFFKKVDLNIEIETNPFFLILKKSGDTYDEPKTETHPQ